jgi:hypothetical protein
MKETVYSDFILLSGIFLVWGWLVCSSIVKQLQEVAKSPKPSQKNKHLIFQSQLENEDNSLLKFTTKKDDERRS